MHDLIKILSRCSHDNTFFQLTGECISDVTKEHYLLATVFQVVAGAWWDTDQSKYAAGVWQCWDFEWGDQLGTWWRDDVAYQMQSLWRWENAAGKARGNVPNTAEQWPTFVCAVHCVSITLCRCFCQWLNYSTYDREFSDDWLFPSLVSHDSTGVHDVVFGTELPPLGIHSCIKCHNRICRLWQSLLRPLWSSAAH